MGSLDGKVALVTGASRGIGAAIAKRFGAEGARVAVTARSLDSHPTLPGTLRDTVDWIERHGSQAVAVAADLAEPSHWASIVARTNDAFGDVDILVNNAAAAFYLPFEATSEKRFRVAYDINVSAPWHLTQLVHPQMKARGEGWVLNISSATSIHPEGPPFPDFAKTATLYGSTKAALERMTTGLAAALHGDGVWVNSMAPVAAVMTEGAVALEVVPEEAAREAESLEAMAEASLALCTTRDPQLTGRITYCTPLLEELERGVRTLDGREARAGPRADQAPPPA